MPSQNYKSHRQFVPLYHFVLYPLLIACLVASVRIAHTAFFVVQHGRLIALALGGLSVAGILLCFFERNFALKAQDRGIRAEENLRHFALTGKLLDKRLTISQVIALRFAEDTEFVILSARAAGENLKPNDIKQAIVNWRADLHRV